MSRSKFDFTRCCMQYMDDLFDMIDDLDEELSRTKTDYQQLDGRFNAVDEMYHTLRDENEELKKQNESYLKALRAANTCVDNLSDKIGSIREIIKDCITCACDEDGREINFVSTNTDDEFEKLMELLEINEDEYLE